MIVAVLGGTGSEGGGLTRRLAAADIQVVLGSRTAEKAWGMAEEIARIYGNHVTGSDNLSAAEQADIVILSVPFSAHQSTLEVVSSVLGGKLLVDIAVPLAPGNPTRYAPPPEGSALAQAQAILMGRCPVVGAFQTIAAHDMNSGVPLTSDVLVVGDDAEAKRRVIALVEAIGGRGVDVGGVEYAACVEALTPMLIGMNMRFKKRGIGVQLTNL